MKPGIKPTGTKITIRIPAISCVGAIILALVFLALPVFGVFWLVEHIFS